jgi:tryptophan-rich sensory protein
MLIGTRVSRSLDGNSRESPLFPLATSLGHFGRIPKTFVASLSKKDKGGARLLLVPLLAYCAHLSLGDAWNKVFFGTVSTGRGLVVICAFWSVLWLSAYLFYHADPYAGLLLLPTCLWVTVAASLNWSIYLLNSERRRV